MAALELPVTIEDIDLYQGEIDKLYKIRDGEGLSKFSRELGELALRAQEPEAGWLRDLQVLGESSRADLD